MRWALAKGARQLVGDRGRPRVPILRVTAFLDRVKRATPGALKRHRHLTNDWKNSSHWRMPPPRTRARSSPSAMRLLENRIAEGHDELSARRDALSDSHEVGSRLYKRRLTSRSRSTTRTESSSDSRRQTAMLHRAPCAPGVRLGVFAGRHAPRTLRSGSVPSTHAITDQP